jgi:uncharacterized SAM-binding protein YcdF (DUF218 family)
MSSVIIVLGSPNDDNGNLLPIAISRCEKALLEYNRIDECKILCTGGFGQHFNVTTLPHGEYVQNYLIDKGVPHSSFLEIALSSFTLEDATLAEPILVNHGITHIVLVTSEFHMERAKLVFNHVLPNFSFDYAEAETLVSAVELQRLREHEEKAIKRDLLNIKNTNNRQVTTKS